MEVYAVIATYYSNRYDPDEKTSEITLHSSRELANRCAELKREGAYDVNIQTLHIDNMDSVIDIF